MSTFDFVKNINTKTGNLIHQNDENQKYYNPFIINRSFSNFSDTVLCANAMNKANHLPKTMQYDYLYGCIKKKPRFGKWIKPEENILEDVLMSYYKVNRSRAREYLSMLTDEDIENLKKITNTGGTNK